jgi:hypothetical protein
MLNRIIRYFDLYSNVRPELPRERGAGASEPSALLQWIALVLGVIIQPYLTQYRTNGAWNFNTGNFWSWLLFSVITAIIVFPAVYKNAFDPKKPILLQLIPIFTSGLGWEALLGAAFKA